MFGNKETKKEQPAKKMNTSSTSSSNSINALVSGTTIEGKVKASNDFRIDGTLIGTLECKGKVIIGPSGVVDGEINCINALIEGKFDGNLRVKELLSVKDSAKITGEIVTDKLLVQSGAVFNVKCQMGGQTISNVSTSQSPSTKSLKKDLVLNA
jgi:cytoskeletal protein CcmA (bactofilin family)